MADASQPIHRTTLDAMKECPFCGSNVLGIGGVGVIQRGSCHACGAVGPAGTGATADDAKRAALEAWNRRAA